MEMLDPVVNSVNQERRIQSIRQAIECLRTYSKDDEVALLGQVSTIVAERQKLASERVGDEALSDTEWSIKENALKILVKSETVAPRS